MTGTERQGCREKDKVVMNYCSLQKHSRGQNKMNCWVKEWDEWQVRNPLQGKKYSNEEWAGKGDCVQRADVQVDWVKKQWIMEGIRPNKDEKNQS
jgi:hypothetical protein